MNYTCNACGWVHFGMTRKEVDAEIARFNVFYDSASPEVQSSYSERAMVKNYTRCFRCGGPHTNFRPAKEYDCPAGCTIQPMLVERTDEQET